MSVPVKLMAKIMIVEIPFSKLPMSQLQKNEGLVVKLVEKCADSAWRGVVFDDFDRDVMVMMMTKI